MFEEIKPVHKLSSKIEDLIAKFQEMKAQNEKLRHELVSVKAQNEAKDTQIAKLEEELRNKDMETDDIFAKIDPVPGRRPRPPSDEKGDHPHRI